MKYKFRVGQKVRYVKDSGYHLDGREDPLKKGDILTISHRTPSNNRNHPSYGFKEETPSRAHWLEVEKNFETVTNKTLKIKELLMSKK